MIIKGRSRSRPAELAAHLSRVDTNERMEIIEVRGTVADDLLGSLKEMAAIAAGTACKRPLYHASLSTRVNEILTLEQWLCSVEELERRLGFVGQPRILVQHSKHNREHMHVVWCRVDARRKVAISDSWNFPIHEEAARHLERLFGHQRTQGAFAERDGVARPQRTPSTADMQQAARLRIDLAALTKEVTQIWRQSGDAAAFNAALVERGYVLARGDRRQYVLVDRAGGVHSLARRVEGARVAAIRKRLSTLDLASLPSIDEAREKQREVQRTARLESAAKGERIPSEVKPRAVFDALLRTRSFVTQNEIKRALEEELVFSPANAVKEILQASDIVRLHGKVTGQIVGYTTDAIRAEEKALIELASKIAARRVRATSSTLIETIIAQRGLDAEQSDAVRYSLSGSQLKLVSGRAGTGKSQLLDCLRQIAEADNRQVIAFSPTNTVAQDLRDFGFARASTLHSFLWYREHAPKHANARIAPRSLVVVDEAAMFDTKSMLKCLQAVPASASIIMVGDALQIGSVERGGMFADMVENIGSAELSTVRRQERHWARAAARAFAEYRFLDGLEAYAERGLIHWTATLDDSRAALLARYEQDTREGTGSRFIFAYTNEECRKLNHGVQEIEIARGRVTNLHVFETERGTLRVGEGDRLAFRGTDKRRGILNGAIATVERIDGGQLTVRTDRAKRISFPINEFSNIDLGYSGSIYRGQGKTLDEVYLFHTSHWRDAASYVALTRSRKSTRIFVARDEVQDVSELARQMDRQGQRGSTLQYLTTTELQRERDAVAANTSEMKPNASSRRREGRSARRRERRRSADRDREQEL